MNRQISFLCSLCLIFNFASCTTDTNHSQDDTMNNITAPPSAMKKDTTIKGGGGERVDSYFWMRLTDEQKASKKPDPQTKLVKAYLETENAYKKAIMEDTEPLQEKLFDEIVGRIKKTDESVPYYKNGYWYYLRYEDGKEYPIYCRKAKSLESNEQIILNVNELAEGYDYYFAGAIEISPNNKILAFSEDTLSRRVYTQRFVNLETGKFLEDKIINSEAGGAWANDNKTYFYTAKNTVSLLSEKIVRHQLGTDQTADEVVYTEKDNSFYIGAIRSKSGKYIFIEMSSTMVDDYKILNADNPTGTFESFTPRGKDHKYTIEHFNNKFYIQTNWNALNFRIMETSLKNTSMENWKEVIPTKESTLINGFEIFSNYLVISEKAEALNKFRIINQSDKTEYYVDMDETAYSASMGNNPEFNTEILRFSYSSFTTPNTTFDFNMKTKERKLMKRQEVIGGHNPEEYTTERLWVTARDGAKIPVSIVYKNNFVKDGTKPLLLYGYGSYGATIPAYFKSDLLSLLDRGFAFATAHIRGSQAIGRQWYEDGKMFKKKNTFTDFIDCGEYLVDSKYTSSEHMYAMGGSAGGLLMGAVANMAPDLFNGILAAVPFVDVVSTMLDEAIPLTTNEFDEWGNPKNFESYQYMLSYSPYDNVTAQNYPNMLVTTGFFDSQVQYWEPAKWVAKLREMKTDNNILLLDTDMESGHGGASGRFARYKRTALEYAFMLKLEGIVQ